MEEQKQNPSKPQQKTIIPAQWQWQSDSDPWKEKDPSKWNWRNYPYDECAMLEIAYSLKHETAELDQYIIDFNQMLQIHKSVKNRSRRVRRQEKSRFMHEVPEPQVIASDVIRFEESKISSVKSFFGSVVNKKVNLYRGLAMNKKEVLEFYNQRKMKYFSWNNVISTTKSLDVAREFLRFSLVKSDSKEAVGVFFVIESDSGMIKDVEGLMDISQDSKYPDEQEVIIAPGVVFELQRVHVNEHNIHEISLKVMKISQENTTDVLDTLDSPVIFDDTVTIDGLSSAEIIKGLRNLQGNKLVKKLEIMNSEIDEKIMEKIESLRTSSNLKKQEIRMRNNTIYVDSFGILAHYFSEDNLDHICSSNSIIFNEVVQEERKDWRINKLVLRKEALNSFKNSKQIKNLVEKIKNEKEITSIDFAMEECLFSEEELRDLVDCIGCLTSLETLDLKLNYMNSMSVEHFDPLCKNIEACKNLQKLSLKFTESRLFSNQLLIRLKEMLSLLAPSLQNLSLNFGECVDITDEGLSHIDAALTSLRLLQNLALDFRGCTKISNNGINNIQNSLCSLISLTHLSLNFESCGGVSDEALSYLKNSLALLPSLKDLSLGFVGCYRITNQGLNHLKTLLISLASLENFSLGFSGCEGITDTGLSYLKNALSSLISLHYLSLDFTACKEITNEGLNQLRSALKQLISLQKLRLTFTSCPKVSDDGLYHLKNALCQLVLLQQLQLEFHYCKQITDNGLNHLKNSLVFLPYLNNLSLNFWGCDKISDEGLASLKIALGFLRNLQRLSLSFYLSKISDKGLNHLKSSLIWLTSLHRLYLDFTSCERITDEGLGYIKNALISLTSLRDVSLCFDNCNKISDQGLNYLKNGLVPLKSLKDGYISMRNCNRISYKAQDDFKNSLASIGHLSLWCK